jgi:xanthine dehydrogenase accessory factor
MKHWQETHRVFDEIAALAAQGRCSALAMIVGLEGSAYRRPGAKLLVRDDGTMIGNVSGGCLENDVREVALKAMKNRRPQMPHYDTTGAEDVIWGMGVGCNGKVDILVVPFASADDVVQSIRDLLKGDLPFAISAVVAPRDKAGRLFVRGRGGTIGTTGAAVLDREIADGIARQLNARESAVFTCGEVRVFTEVLVPPPDVVIIGAGDDSIPLVRLATESGFRVTLVDHRKAYLTPERFPDAIRLVEARAEDPVRLPASANTLVVVKAHILVQDRAWVQRYASTPVPYIGLLGSRSRRDEILGSLTPEQRGRVYGPVGLDLGAEGPEQVAVSIVAELMAVRARRAPVHLRDRSKGIHAPP